MPLWQLERIADAKVWRRETSYRAPKLAKERSQGTVINSVSTIAKYKSIDPADEVPRRADKTISDKAGKLQKELESSAQSVSGQGAVGDSFHRTCQVFSVDA
jgi:hypothetical protein